MLNGCCFSFKHWPFREPSIPLLYVCLTVLLRNYISGEEGKRSIEQRSLEHLCQAAYMAGKTSSPTWWQVILTAGGGGA